MDTMELREIEDTKIHCAREHFKASDKNLTKCIAVVLGDGAYL